jgi:hypothetical protein
LSFRTPAACFRILASCNDFSGNRGQGVAPPVIISRWLGQPGEGRQVSGGVFAAYASRQGDVLALPSCFSRNNGSVRRTGLHGPRVRSPATELFRPSRRWLLLQRTRGEAPRYWDDSSNAPASVPCRVLGWRRGVRWAVEQCFAETQSALGLAPYEVRKYAGWWHHRLTGMLAHFFLGHLKIRLGKKSASAYGLPRAKLTCLWPL